VLKTIIQASSFEWKILTEVYTEYSEADAEFHLLVVKRESLLKNIVNNRTQFLKNELHLGNVYIKIMRGIDSLVKLRKKQAT